LRLGKTAKAGRRTLNSSGLPTIYTNGPSLYFFCPRRLTSQSLAPSFVRCRTLICLR
jgi:hypothetical protein